MIKNMRISLDFPKIERYWLTTSSLGIFLMIKRKALKIKVGMEVSVFLFSGQP